MNTMAKPPRTNFDDQRSTLSPKLTVSNETSGLKNSLAINEENFPTLHQIKLDPSTIVTQPHAVNISSDSCRSKKIVCPLDHIFRKKQPEKKKTPVVKLPTSEKIHIKNDQNDSETFTCPTVTSPNSGHVKLMLASEKVVANTHENDFPSQPTVKPTTLPGSFKAVDAPWKPKKIICPLDHIFGKKTPVVKLPKNEKTPFRGNKETEISSGRLSSSSPTSDRHVLGYGTNGLVVSSQETNVMFPSLLAVTKVSSDNKKAPVKGKGSNPTSPIKKMPTDKSLPDASDVHLSSAAKDTPIAGSSGVELKSSETKTGAKDKDPVKELVLAGTTVAEVSHASKSPIEKQVTTNSPSNDQSNSSPIESVASTVSFGRRSPSRKEIEKQQKALRKAAQQARRIAKSVHNKRDATLVGKQANSKVTTQLEAQAEESVSATDTASVDTNESREVPPANQQTLLDIEHAQEPCEAKELYQLQKLLTKVKSDTNNAVKTDFVCFPSQVKAFDGQLREEFPKLVEEAAGSNETRSMCSTIGVLDNNNIAKRGGDPMAFIWSHSKGEKEPDYPRPHVLSNRTISQEGSNPVAWIWKRSSEDFEEDYPRAVSHSYSSSKIQYDEEKEQTPEILANCTMLVPRPNGRFEKIEVQDFMGPFADSAALTTQTITTTADTCKTDNNSHIGTARNSEIFELAAEKARLRSSSDSNAGSMITTATGISDNSTITIENPVEAVSSRKESQTVPLSITTETTETSLEDKLFSKLQSMKAITDALDKRISVIEAENNMLKAKVKRLESDINATEVVAISTPPTEPTLSEANQVITKAMTFIHNMVVENESSMLVTEKVSTELYDNLLPNGELPANEIRTFAKKAQALSMLANIVVGHAVGMLTDL